MMGAGLWGKYKDYKCLRLINYLSRPQSSNMKFLLIVCGVFGVVMGQNPYHQAYIVRYDNDNDGLGQYQYGFETSDGFRHDQTGQLQNIGTENEVMVMKGSYSYIGADGVTYTVFYTADENGFHPEGAHIPQSAGVNKLA